MGYAFMSYSSRNVHVTDELRSILNKNGIDTWMAPDDIPVGSRYAEVINKAIKNCACLVLLLTEESMASQWVAKEVERAINYNKTIIPIKLEDVTLNDEFELYISTDQILSVDSTDEKSAQIQRLISTLRSSVAGSDYEKYMLLATGKHSVVETVTSPEAKQAVFKAPVSKKSPLDNKVTVIVIICAILLTAAIVFAAVLPQFINTDNGNSGDNNLGSGYGDVLDNDKPDTDKKEDDTTKSPQGDEPSHENGDGVQRDEPSSEEHSSEKETDEAVEVIGENHIPSKWESKITSLQHSPSSTVSLFTIRVKVGEYATPSAAAIWPDVVIYSQNTGVAAAEGILVKGVAKGETYIFVESMGMNGSAYLVIVE